MATHKRQTFQARDLHVIVIGAGIYALLWIQIQNPYVVVLTMVRSST